MDIIVIEGGRPLIGTVRVRGAKNAALPILAAALLSPGKTRLSEVPALQDVQTMCNVLRELGARVEGTREALAIDAGSLENNEAPYDLVRRMRASFLVMGPLLARFGSARVSLPGGCAIGSRPINLHLKGFAALGARITMGYGYVEARASRLEGARICLDYPSVGATENLMMAACLARGTTMIENAAAEPEVGDLADLLNAMGARVKGVGSRVVTIEGVSELHGAEHRVIPDRIEAGTYLIAGAITGGSLRVENVITGHLEPLLAKLREAGFSVEEDGWAVNIQGGGRPGAVDVKTMPYPGFPTDLQPQIMALMTMAEGIGLVTENVFENRFMHVDELKRMGAHIRVQGRTAVVEGVPTLAGARVKATDLRAGAAMVLAGLAAGGRTEIAYVHHIDRGYVEIEETLRRLGANIERHCNQEATTLDAAAFG